MAYYVLALPLGIALAFHTRTHMGLQGLWLGMLSDSAQSIQSHLSPRLQAKWSRCSSSDLVNTPLYGWARIGIRRSDAVSNATGKKRNAAGSMRAVESCSICR